MKIKKWYVYNDTDEGTEEYPPEFKPQKIMTYLKASKGMRLVNKVTGESCVSIVVENEDVENYEEVPGIPGCTQKH